MDSQLSREDMLRELELLPVWQLKQPLPSMAAQPPAATETAAVASERITDDMAAHEAPVQETAQVEILTVEATEYTVEETEYKSAAEELAAAMPLPMPLRMLLSEDSSFAFLIEPYPAEADASAVETLLKNMIRAMQLNCRVDITDTADKLFVGHAPRLIISFGAAPANVLLGKTSDLDEWRNAQLENQPLHENIPLLVTYHPAHLLENVSDKAHAWRDLCFAMKLIQVL